MNLSKQDFHRIKHTAFQLNAPLSGKLLPQTESRNPLVKNKILGLGVTIEVTNYQLFSPYNGTLLSIEQAGCEFVLKANNGLKTLILIDCDARHQPLKGYKQHTTINKQVSCGQLIASFDFRHTEKPVYADIILLDIDRLSTVIDTCYYQANRITAQHDILFKLTKRQN